jgi:putative DNA primase/helicase
MIAENVPDSLKARPQWICWKAEERKGKTTKIPYSVYGGKAATDNPSTWTSFYYAATYAADHEMDGVGFVFSENDPYLGIDLDHVRSVDTGDIDVWAWEIAAHFSSYTEVSPSGKGLHILVRATLPPGPRRKGQIEIYDRLRYFTVTGDRVGEWCDVECRQAELDAFYTETFGEGAAKTAPSSPAEVGSLTLTPDADPPFGKFEALRENSTKFKRSWERGRKDLKDQSASGYDLSLASFAVEAGWTDQEIANLIIAARRKHGDDLKLRQDYYARTIGRARESQAQAEQADDAEVVLNAPEAERPDADTDQGREEILRALSAVLEVTIQRIVKYTSTPAIYRIFTDVGDVPVKSSESLLSQTSMRALIFEATQKRMPRLKAAKWERVIDLIGAVLEIEDAEEASTEVGQARRWLWDYLAARMPVDSLQEAAKRKTPYVAETMVHIFGEDFRKWLMLDCMTKLSAREMGAQFRRIGAIPHTVGIELAGQATTRHVWQLPAEYQPSVKHVAAGFNQKSP